MKSQASTKPKILVVDDELDNLDLLYRTFRRDYKVLKTDNGTDALEILGQENDVAVIISDQRMPNMSGTELLRLTAAKYPNTIRIILTGYTDVEDLVDAINAGKVFKYVTKPWDTSELQAIVKQALDTHNLLKIQTEELHRSLRRESLLNSVTNTIRNPQYGSPDGSPLKDVLQRIVDTLGQVLEVDICILRPFDDHELVDEEWFLYQKSRGNTSILDSNSQTSLQLTVWETHEIEVINDVATDERLTAQTPEIQQRIEAFQKSDIHSTLVVPLIFQLDLMAVLAMHRCGQTHIWEGDEIQLTVMVADQAVLAISQARAYEQVRALAQRETLVNTITSTIRSTLNPQEIFTAITKQLGEALRVDGCVLSLWTKEDQFVQCVGLYDRNQSRTKEDFPEPLNQESLPQSVVPISENPVLQKLLDTLKPVVFEDMEEHNEMMQFELPLRSPARALLVVPLIVDGEIIGSISLRKTDHSRIWTQSNIDLAEAVASQAAIAVQQARLYETTRQQAERLLESEQRVTQLNKYLTESVLKRFLPEAMVNKAAAGDLLLDLSPEPRLVTILFSDIVGFTPLSNQLGSRQVAQLLNEYLEKMTCAVFENGGTVDKFIGDAVLALFGSPEELLPNEQVKRAIAVARAMYYYLNQLNQSWQEKGIVGSKGISPVQFRCGIHQGNAVVGMFGGGQRSDYTAIGPAVNMAARLQEAADPKHILVSAAVAEYLKQEEIIQVKKRKLKGIEEDVLTFSVAINPQS